MLVRMKVQLIHQKSIWGSRTWLCLAPVRHLVSLGPIGASAWDIVGFMLTRDWYPQDFQGDGILKEKMNSTIQMDFLCIITSSEIASLTTMPKIYAEKSTDGLIP